MIFNKNMEYLLKVRVIFIRKMYWDGGSQNYF